MPTFSAASQKQRATLHPKLQEIVDEAIKYFDFAIIEGHRGEEAQTKAYLTHKSKVPWPKGKHNQSPSKAMDCAPYPIDWSDEDDAIRRFCYMAGFFMCIARQKGIKLRWGADWDKDDDLRDEKGKLRDFPHLELVEE